MCDQLPQSFNLVGGLLLQLVHMLVLAKQAKHI